MTFRYTSPNSCSCYCVAKLYKCNIYVNFVIVKLYIQALHDLYGEKENVVLNAILALK